MVRVDLSGYGYVNARVRGMRAHLLKKDFFMRLVEVEDFEALHSLLEQTAYRREVNEEVLIKPENPDFDQAFNLNLIACLLKIHDSTGGEPRKLVSLLFSRYDVENVKAILRGKKGGASPGEILNATIPVGNIKMDKLEELARQREIPDVLKVMAALRIKYARPLA
ncbi:MAG: V-type ATPase subunit, partial [Actinobacteria bacterium]|nr:V-type ATPase subunit [Actinomycetota bacterium]